jgi:hypothetical protein
MTVSVAFPTMIDKIIAALGAAATLTGIRVFDGAEVDESFPSDAIAIGHDGSFGDSEMQAGSINNTPLSFTDQHQEDGSISCALWTQDGGTNLTAKRIRAFSVLSKIDTVIRADPTFTGTCFYSHLEAGQVGYMQTSMGSAVVITFTITYQAQS